MNTLVKSIIVSLFINILILPVNPFKKINNWHIFYENIGFYEHHWYFTNMSLCLLITLSFLFIKSKKHHPYAYLRQYANLDKLQKMDWGEFEELVKKIFEIKGYQVQRIGGNGADGGIDLIATKNNISEMIQCKRYKDGNNVGVKVVREVGFLMNHHGHQKCHIYTSAKFTNKAIELAGELPNMSLADGQEIVQEIKKILNQK